MSFILCRFMGNTAMTRVWRSFGLQEQICCPLLEVKSEAQQIRMTGFKLLLCRPFSIVFHVHRELFGAGSDTNFVAKLMTTSIAILEMWGTLTACEA